MYIIHEKQKILLSIIRPLFQILLNIHTISNHLHFAEQQVQNSNHLITA